MSRQPTDNHAMAYFGAPSTRTLVTRTLGAGVVSFNRLSAEDALGPIDNSVVEDAIMVAYQHRAVSAHVFLEGRYIQVPGQSQDRVTMYDYRHRWGCDIKTAYEATNVAGRLSSRPPSCQARAPTICRKSCRNAWPGALRYSIGMPRSPSPAMSSPIRRSPGRKAGAW